MSTEAKRALGRGKYQPRAAREMEMFGVDEMRRRWRERATKYRTPHPPREGRCMVCGEPIILARGHTYGRCPACREGGLTRFVCHGCDRDTVSRRRSGLRRSNTYKYCTLTCYQAYLNAHPAIRRDRRTAYFARVAPERERQRVARHIGESCAITVAKCPECPEPVTSHTTSIRGRYCSELHYQRGYMRDYQRRTRATAIRYWRVAPTPEAQALAETYYELRQELRRRTHG